MNKITFGLLSLASLFFAEKIIAQGAFPESILIEKAKSIHEKVITIDTHCDINLRNFTSNKNYTQNLATQVNLPKMIE